MRYKNGKGVGGC